MRTSTLTYLTFSLGLLAAGTATAQTARVQVIHNCADAAAAEVDIYLNGDLLLDNVAFRTASSFMDAPAGMPITVAIAPGNSTNAGEAIFSQQLTLADGGSYIVVASGIVSPAGYEPAPAFSLAIFDGAREVAEGTGTDVLVIHGSTDAPTVDVFESAVVESTIVDDISYPEFQGYLELPVLDLTLQVRAADNSAIVAAYGAPLATLGLDGAAITVLASGFLNPASNSNGAGFGLFVATAAGGPLVALPAAQLPTPARAQVIHNSADAAAATVDIYLNGDLLLNDFAFRTATPFVDLPSTVTLTIGVAPGNSTGAGDAIAEFEYVLEEGGTYVIVAGGIVSASGYAPATPFDLFVNEGRETAMDMSNTDVLVYHGATDAPTVDVAETAVLGGDIIVSNISHGEFQGYLELPTLDFVLQVQTTGGAAVAAYQAPLASLELQGAALVVLASGFLDPAMNSNGEPFGLYVALPAGGPLVSLPLSTGIASRNSEGLRAWPNPASEMLFLGLENGAASAEVRLLDAMGRMVRSFPAGTAFNSGDRLVLDVSGIGTGTYLLDVNVDGDRRTMPVVVGH